MRLQVAWKRASSSITSPSIPRNVWSITLRKEHTTENGEEGMSTRACEECGKVGGSEAKARQGQTQEEEQLRDTGRLSYELQGGKYEQEGRPYLWTRSVEKGRQDGQVRQAASE